MVAADNCETGAVVELVKAGGANVNSQNNVCHGNLLCI